MTQTDEIIIDKAVKTEKYEVYMHSDDTLCVHYFENCVVEAEDIKETMRIGKEMSPSDDTKVIVKLDTYVEVTKDAREYAQNNVRKLKAEAHVVPSMANRLMFNFFVKLRNTNHPIKALSRFEDAVKWLDQY